MKKEILLSVYEELIKGSSIQRLVDIMRAHLGNPLALCDCNLNPIACSRESGIDDFIWTCVTSEDRALHYEFEQFGKQAGILNKVRYSDGSVLIENEKLKHRYLNMSVFNRDAEIGNVVLLEYNREFSGEDRALFEQFSRILAFALHKIVPTYTQNPNATLIMEHLLNGVHVSKNDISRYLSVSKNGNCYTIVVLKQDRRQERHRSLALEQNILRQKYPQKMAIHKNTLVVLFQAPQRYGKPIIDWDKLVQTAKGMNFLVGVSHPFHEITELSLYYDQAVNAINYGELHAGAKDCYFWEDVSFCYLLSIAQRDGDLMKFYHPAFSELVMYDLKNGTKWLRTLYYYLYFNSDINAAASVMHINRNSMYYRINKIQEIVGPIFQERNFNAQMKLSMNIFLFQEGEAFFTKQEIPPEFRTISFF